MIQILNMKIAVLGAGHLGKIHIEIIKSLPEFNLIGFFDSNKLLSNQLSKELSVKAFDSMAKLLEETEVVDIVTPTLSHFECARKALFAGKHIFIEKPVTSSYAEAKELMRIANGIDVKIQIGHVERFNPAFLAAKPYIDTPLFIETHRLSKYNHRGTDVSVVLDLMIHDIDVILHIVKSEVSQIHTSGVAILTDNPDICNARIEFENGCVANLTSSRVSMKEMRKTRIFQKDRYVSIDFLNKKTEIVGLSSAQSWNPLKMKFPIDINGTKRFVSHKKPRVKQLNAIQEELRSFASSIKNNNLPTVTLQDGCEALKISDLIIDKVTDRINKNNA